VVVVVTMPMRDVTPIGKPAKKARKASKRATTSDPKFWRKRADALWGKLVHERDRVCQVCGRATGKLDAHHILPRTFVATRWEPDNGVLVCWQHHAALHARAGGDSFSAVLVYEGLRGARYQELRTQAYAGAKFGIQDLRDICADLEAQIGRLR